MQLVELLEVTFAFSLQVLTFFQSSQFNLRFFFSLKNQNSEEKIRILRYWQSKNSEKKKSELKKNSHVPLTQINFSHGPNPISYLGLSLFIIIIIIIVNRLSENRLRR